MPFSDIGLIEAAARSLESWERVTESTRPLWALESEDFVHYLYCIPYLDGLIE
jgi:hypothetical protein